MLFVPSNKFTFTVPVSLKSTEKLMSSPAVSVKAADLKSASRAWIVTAREPAPTPSVPKGAEVSSVPPGEWIQTPLFEVHPPVIMVTSASIVVESKPPLLVVSLMRTAAEAAPVIAASAAVMARKERSADLFFMDVEL